MFGLDMRTIGRITGVLFFAAFVGIASGSSTPVIVLAFTAAVVLAWIWLAVVAARFRRTAS